jgi:hypothetical protein
MQLIYADDAQAIKRQSDLYWTFAEAMRACADLLDYARRRLESIDANAHDEIQKAIDSWKGGGWFGPSALVSQIWAIVSRARADAETLCIDVVRKIAAEAVRIANSEVPSKSVRGNTSPGARNPVQAVGFGTEDKPMHWGPSGAQDKPLTPAPEAPPEDSPLQQSPAKPEDKPLQPEQAKQNHQPVEDAKLRPTASGGQYADHPADGHSFTHVRRRRIEAAVDALDA